jgi:cytochrome P450
VERLNGQHEKMAEATKIIDEFAYGIIDQRQAEGRGNFTAETKKDAKNLDLLSLYMALRDENGQPMSRRALRYVMLVTSPAQTDSFPTLSDAVLNLIIAGRDTTAQALSWTFFHLLKHPEVLEPVRTEVAELGVIDYDSYKILHQTNAVFSEGLRLHPSVPKNGWTVLQDDVLPNGGPMVKAGDVVFWSDWVMARDESIWGPDAREFKPSRWLDEQGELRKESQWKAHMFNGGYRLCLGE